VPAAAALEYLVQEWVVMVQQELLQLILVEAVLAD
jgi:hypothetical protein